MSLLAQAANKAGGGGTSVAAVIALVLSGLAVLVSVVGTVISNRRATASNTIAAESNRIASAALEESRAAVTNELWSEAIEAVLRVMVDPTTEPLTDRFPTLRVRLIALVDGLPDWTGFDRWLSVEHRLGAVVARQAMEHATTASTLEEHFEKLKPFFDWGATFAQNLRRCRNVGYCPEEIDSLREHASTAIRDVCARNSWPLPRSEL